MRKKRVDRISLTRQSLIFSIVVILFLSLSNIILTYFGQIKIFEMNLAAEENLYLGRELSASKSQIQSIEAYIEIELAYSELSFKEEIRSSVIKSHKIALSLYELNKDKMNEETLKELIKNTLTSLDLTDTIKCNIIGNIKGEIIFFQSPFGNNISAFPGLNDVKNIYPIDRAIKIASSPEKEGFLEWEYISNKATNKEKKIGYVIYFEPYNWFIGNGEYLYTAKNNSRKKIIETIKNIYGNQEPYILIGKSDGSILLAPYEMDSFYDLGKSGEIYVWDIFKNFHEKPDSFVDYPLPESITGYPYSKITYMGYIPELDWYLGSGINLDLLSAQNQAMDEELKSILFRNYTMNIILSLAAFIVAVYLFAYYNKSLDKEFEMIDDFFSNASESYKRLDVSKFKYRELSHLASTANKMIDEIHKQKIALEKYSKRMSRLAQMDSLTKLLNHSSIMKNVQNRMHEAARYATPLSAIMLDIDNFKLINDTYGHPFGDRVLAKIANILKKSLRDTDIIGRYGGEEFLILLPNTNLDDAWLTAEKIRKSVESASWKSKAIRVTISGGVAEYSGQYNHQLVGAADKKLYEAKALGKNRMVK